MTAMKGSSAMHDGAAAGNFLAEIEKAHANPLPGDPLAKSTFSESTSPISGLTYYDLETGAKASNNSKSDGNPSSAPVKASNEP